VFSKSRDMYIYLQAYEPDVPAIQPLIAFVSVYRDQEKVFEAQPMLVKTALTSRLKTVPLTFSVPINQLSSGRYDCQITVLDPVKQKAAFWRAPIMVVP